MRFAVDADAFDRRYLMAFTYDGKRQACKDTPTVNPDGASATGSLVASLLGTGKFEMLAECVEQAGARLQIDQTLGSVDAKRDVRAGRPTLNLRGGDSSAIDARLGRH
jgi:hypothetical protein